MTDAHIFWCRDDGDFPVERLGTALAPAEREELAGFTGDLRRRDFTISRALLRHAFTRCLGMPADALRFRRDSDGRLLFATPGPWQFSLSHCPGMVAIVVAGSACGIDVERPRDAAVMKVAERYFADAETAWLRARTEDRQQRDFFRLWTLKEAGVKALGQGLAHNLSKLAFTLGDAGPRLLAPSPALQLQQLDLDSHLLAAAVATNDKVRWHVSERALADLSGDI
jgi:4'-phosphopantetheinyl transferase